MKGFFNLIGAVLCFIAVFFFTIGVGMLANAQITAFSHGDTNAVQFGAGVLVDFMFLCLTAYLLETGISLFRKRFN